MGMIDLRKQNMMLKKMINTTETALTKKPAGPIQNGPWGTFLRPVNRWGPMARA